MLIRPAQKKDLAACAKVFCVPEVREAGGEYLAPEFLANYLDADYFLIAEEAGTIQGAIFGEPLRGRGAIVHNLVVAEKLRGAGIGSALLEKFEAKARANKLDWILLYAPLSDVSTCNFYRGRGYRGENHLVEKLKLFDQAARAKIYLK